MVKCIFPVVYRPENNHDIKFYAATGVEFAHDTLPVFIFGCDDILLKRQRFILVKYTFDGNA